MNAPYPPPPKPGNYHFGVPVLGPTAHLAARPTPETLKRALDWQAFRLRVHYQRYGMSRVGVRLQLAH